MKLIVASIYRPNANKNRHTETDINKVRKRITTIRNNPEFENHLAIFIGDFNEAPNPAMDRLKASDTPNSIPRTMIPEVDRNNSLLYNTLENGEGDIYHPLIDIWREQHPNNKEYSHQVSNIKFLHPSQSRIDLALIKTNTIQHVLKSWIEPDFWDTGMHHKAIGITLNTPLPKLQSNKHSNKMKILKFNGKNTQSHVLEFINAIKNGLSDTTLAEPTISTINWHEILNEAAKNSGSLRTKGSHTRNWKNKKATSSTVTGLRKLHNLIMQEQQETVQPIKNALHAIIREKIILLHKKVTGEEYIEGNSIMETYQTTKKIININTRKEIRKHISQQTKLRSREYGTIINQKRHIKSLLEHKTFLEPITYTRNPNTNQIITEPTEMKESLLKNYQRVHATRPPANLETLPFLINIQEIYDPNPDISQAKHQLMIQWSKYCCC